MGDRRGTDGGSNKNGFCRLEKRHYVAIGIFALVIIVCVAVFVTVFKKISKNNTPKYTYIQTSCITYEGLAHLVKTDEGKEMDMYEFRNIPYASPPVGKLRFRPPTAWNECDKNNVMKYTKDIIDCAQSYYGEKSGREDCLILAIRTPFNSESSRLKKKLPVLFWIHGGGMMYGSSSWKGYFPNEQFTASMDVVSVSINYRLDVLGFLSLKELWIMSGKNKSYGNYGVMDQIMALEWVRDNIEYFGGDKNQVTIFGESGGGKAVFDLISSPLAKGLFNKAIPSSGYPMALLETHHFANSKFRVFLDDTNCNKDSEEETVNCLQTISVDTILDNIPQYKYNDSGAFWWVFPYNITNNAFPLDVIDNYVIPAPIGNIREVPNGKMDILVGNMAQEGSIEETAFTWDGLRTHLKPKVDSFESGIYDQLVKLYNESREGKITPKEITSQYVYTIASSDVLLSCQTNEIAGNLSMFKNVTVYRYMVSQTQLYGTDTVIPTAYHGIDTEALFGNLNVHNPTKHDKKLMLNLRKFFQKFIYSQLDAKQYVNKTIDFWNDTIVTTESPYHKKECEFLRDHGFLKKAWGQIGV